MSTSDVARETIRRLASRRMPPTPENYAEIYAQVSGVPSTHPAVSALRHFADGCDRVPGVDANSAKALRVAIEEGNWTRLGPALGHLVANSAPRFPEPRAAAVAPEEPSVAKLKELLSQTIVIAVSERLGYAPALAERANEIAKACIAAQDAPAVEKVAKELKEFWLKLELRGEAVDEVIRSLRSLVAVLTENMADLVSDDRWLKGQVMRAQSLVNDPIDAHAIVEAERGLRQAAFRQAMLKASLDEAKSALKTMVTLILERIGTVVETTGGFQARIEKHAERVSAAKNIGEISDVVTAMLSDVRMVGTDVKRVQGELEQARREAEEKDREVHRLQAELASVSEQVRHDPLTELLNRRGFEEAIHIEHARAERTGSALSIAMLDLDNFKAVNTRLGHAGGDGALTHLARVLKKFLRPTDVVCRYGGEEFVILMPHTSTEQGVQVMVRLQRELTKRFFLHGNEKVFITFSAGVAQKRPGEGQADVIERADQSMLEAKKAGKNRVLASR